MHHMAQHSIKIALSIALACTAQHSLAADTESAAVLKHVKRAYVLAGDSFARKTADLQCGTDVNVRALFADKTVPEPTKVFDNLYYVGLTPVGAWAITTSEGIILIDALYTTGDARDVIESGLVKLGLDPATIKYIIVTHGHGDHSGGAQYLADKYGSRVLLAEADWENAINPPQRPGGPAKKDVVKLIKDMVATDGQQLTLGDTTVQIVTTPGHTPGTISLLFPVYDRGEKHIAGLWGGTGIPKNIIAASNYVDSSIKFAKASKAANADVTISNHPFVDDSLNKMQSLPKTPDDAHPFVIGSDSYQRYSGVITECAAAAVARIEDPKPE
jgi:metallo-beta-lactamase class B